MAVSEREALLGDTVFGALDYKGYPVSRSTTGGWRSASFIIGGLGKKIERKTERQKILQFYQLEM